MGAQREQVGHGVQRVDPDAGERDPESLHLPPEGADEGSEIAAALHTRHRFLPVTPVEGFGHRLRFAFFPQGMESVFRPGFNIILDWRRLHAAGSRGKDRPN